MRYDINDVYKLLQTVHANQINMIGLLNRVLTKENEMAVDLTALQDEVANNSTVEGSVIALLKQLADMIAAIPASNDKATQDALDQLVASLRANDQSLADSVVANTPPSVTSARTSAKTS